MRDTPHIDEMINQLRSIWLQHPELRLGQLIEQHNTGIDTFYIEDSLLLTAIEQSLIEPKQKL